MRGLAVLVVIANIASADPAPNRIEVEVGKTAERDVGVLRGFFCDDPSLVAADLVTRGQTNVWIVTGQKVGTTQCRVGDHTRPALVFDVIVKASK
ncbi:MAG TPA: hypothetical protein VH143_07790 [Kofleriaceae bacterium]|jgi:hypothetical protein|nr:hypothetical protein [Kofleriaceae bacterium]